MSIKTRATPSTGCEAEWVLLTTLHSLQSCIYLAAAFPLNTAIIPRLISPYSASTQQREQVFSEGVHLPHAAICHLPTLLPTLTALSPTLGRRATLTLTPTTKVRARAPPCRVGPLSATIAACPLRRP